ncbi:hypothetical protein POHY109586_23915 [Polaromonas hydrogenivorans]
MVAPEYTRCCRSPFAWLTVLLNPASFRPCASSLTPAARPPALHWCVKRKVAQWLYSTCLSWRTVAAKSVKHSLPDAGIAGCAVENFATVRLGFSIEATREKAGWRQACNTGSIRRWHGSIVWNNSRPSLRSVPNWCALTCRLWKILKLKVRSTNKERWSATRCVSTCLRNGAALAPTAAPRVCRCRSSISSPSPRVVQTASAI